MPLFPESLTEAAKNGNGSDSRHKPANFLIPVLQKRQEGVDRALLNPSNPPNYGKVPVPHVLSFASILSTAAKTYRDSDEATLHSLDNARHMRNDCGIMECLEQRQRLTALLDWHLEPEDETSPEQVACVEALDKIIRKIKRFTEYRRNLMEATWFGKYGIQHAYNWNIIGGKAYAMPWPNPVNQFDHWGWEPICGDKIDFRFDDGKGFDDPGKFAGQMGIRVGAGFNAGDTVNNGRSKVESTSRGLSYFLSKWERQLVVVHKHMIEDVPWEDSFNSGRIHGVGIRSRIYWDWFQKQECLAMLIEFLERSAGGIEVWRYPSGNPQAKQETETAAANRIGNSKNIVLVPTPTGEDAMAYGVEIIEPGMAGIEQLKDLLVTYFGHRIKRYILGQTLSSEADATGLGSGVAELHLDTLLSIVKFDATNLEETLTDQLVQPIKDFNFPHARGFNVRFVIETQSENIAEKMEAFEKAYNMGAKLKASQVMETIGAAMPDPEDEILQNPQMAQAAAMGGMPGGAGVPGQQPGNPTSVAFDAESLSAEVMQNLWGDPASAEGQTMTYVAEGGKWVQRQLPAFDTGDRQRAEDGEPDRFSKSDHWKEQPRDDDGKFAETGGGSGHSQPDSKSESPAPHKPANEHIGKHFRGYLPGFSTEDEDHAFENKRAFFHDNFKKLAKQLAPDLAQRMKAEVQSLADAEGVNISEMSDDGMEDFAEEYLTEEFHASDFEISDHFDHDSGKFDFDSASEAFEKTVSNIMDGPFSTLARREFRNALKEFREENRVDRFSKDSGHRAPQGGMTSNVNGQWYEGGEFMPTHGLFAGKAGEKRKAKWEKFEKQGKVKDLGGSKMFEVTEYVGGGISNILGYAIAEDHREAAAAFTAKTKTYAKQV